MKKSVSLILLIIIFLCSCKSNELQKPSKNNSPDRTLSGVWVTYSELNEFLKSDDFKENIKELSQNLQTFGITDAFIQVRPFCDSLYKSEFFPQNELSAKFDFDVFSFIINSLHEKNIKVHAWINPYRVKTADSDIDTLNHDSPAYKWLTDGDSENDKNVCISDGIYLNPSSDDVKRLIISGIKEILENYCVDGIHIDDYFYPTTSPDFDKLSYDEYLKKSWSPLPLNEYRISNVNSLISSIYTTTKFFNKDLIFSISPSASIKRNLEEYYADIETWLKNGCVDLIIPQIYFGFNYPEKEYRFGEVLKNYKKLPLNSAKLAVGLATYKIRTEQEPDNIEWKNGFEIIKKQIEICENDPKICGYVFFSYSSFTEYMKSTC